jgi:hypothetical protein
MQAREAEAKERDTQAREAAMAAKFNHVLEGKAAELATIKEEKVQLQALVNESAAARAELQQVSLKCVPLQQLSPAMLLVKCIFYDVLLKAYYNYGVFRTFYKCQHCVLYNFAIRTVLWFNDNSIALC